MCQYRGIDQDKNQIPACDNIHNMITIVYASLLKTHKRRTNP